MGMETKKGPPACAEGPLLAVQEGSRYFFALPFSMMTTYL